MAKPDDLKCEYCGKVTEAKLYDFGFFKKWIHPACPCRIEEYERMEEERERQERLRKIQNLFSNSNLGTRYSNCTFEQFERRKGAEEGLCAAMKFAENFKPGNGHGIMMYGGYGGGKTHLAVAILQDLLQRGYPCVFVVVPELLDRIRASYNRESKESEDKIIKTILKADMVVLDDLGAEQMTEWVQDKLYTIINGLYVRNIPIVVTTNCKITELQDRLGGRTFSRIIDMTSGVKFDAADYRMLKLRK